MAIPKRYVLRYGSLSPKLRESVDEIRAARSSKLLLVPMAGAVALSTQPVGAAYLAAAGTALLAKAERDVISATRRMGELVADKPARVFSPELIGELRKRGLTHAHVDRKGNFIFTNEPKYYGREIIPHPLKLRWRMKVPLFLEKAR